LIKYHHSQYLSIRMGAASGSFSQARNWLS